MEYKLNNGAYTVDENGNLIGIEYIEQVLQNVSLMLSANRGKFYPDKNFGSSISKNDASLQALAYARQALSELDGVCVKSALMDNDSIIFSLLINEEERSVTISK